MPDVEREPVELTIRKMEIAWEIVQKAGTSGGNSATKLDEMLRYFRQAYEDIGEIVQGEKKERSQ